MAREHRSGMAVAPERMTSCMEKDCAPWSCPRSTVPKGFASIQPWKPVALNSLAPAVHLAYSDTEPRVRYPGNVVSCSVFANFRGAPPSMGFGMRRAAMPLFPSRVAVTSVVWPGRSEGRLASVWVEVTVFVDSGVDSWGLMRENSSGQL